MQIMIVNCRETRKACLLYLKMAALVIFIFPNLIYQSNCHELGSGRGSSCKSTDDCDKSRFLECIGPEKICECRRAVGKIWNPDENSCMIMEEAPCGRKPDEPKCITNSSCITGKCACDDGFLKNGFGKCELSYGEVCSNGEKCADRYSLECTNKSSGLWTCRCQHEGIEFEWDDEKQKCVSTAGSYCDLPGSALYGKDNQLECIKNAECVGTGQCQCKKGFSQTPEAACTLQFGETCNPAQGLNCNIRQFLLCRDGMCVCEFYDQMVYVPETEQCQIKAGEACDIESEHEHSHDRSNYDVNNRWSRCVPNSRCESRPGSKKRGVCTCLHDMVKLDDGTCSRYNKTHGLPCSTSIDCDKKKFLECVPDEIEGSRCGCIQNEMYFDGNQCRVFPGRSCTKNKLCTDRAYCEGEWCTCDKGFRHDISTMTCVLEDRDLATNSPNPDNRLISSNCDDFLEGSTNRARCHCQVKSHSHVWIEEESKCLTLVGNNCFSDSDCVPNAICDDDVKTCQCSPGSHTTRVNTCIPPMNSKHAVDNQHGINCHESHTQKSPRSQEYLDSSSGTETARGANDFTVLIIGLLYYSLSIGYQSLFGIIIICV